MGLSLERWLDRWEGKLRMMMTRLTRGKMQVRYTSNTGVSISDSVLKEEPGKRTSSLHWRAYPTLDLKI